MYHRRFLFVLQVYAGKLMLRRSSDSENLRDYTTQTRRTNQVDMTSPIRPTGIPNMELRSSTEANELREDLKIKTQHGTL